MIRELYDRLVATGALTFGDPKPKREIASDNNLSLAALDNQIRAERDAQDPYTMTADKLAKKVAGMGAASLQLPPGLAERYDLNRWREEDEEILKAEQAKEHDDARDGSGDSRGTTDGGPDGGCVRGVDDLEAARGSQDRERAADSARGADHSVDRGDGEGGNRRSGLDTGDR